MNLNDALNAIIDDGIIAAKADYTKPNQNLKLEGSIKGFKDCRGKTPEQLKTLLEEALKTSEEKFFEQATDYWFWRCRTLEIEWVCNVISCILLNNKLPPISVMTARGMLKAADIIGVKA